MLGDFSHSYCLDFYHENIFDQIILSLRNDMRTCFPLVAQQYAQRSRRRKRITVRLLLSL